VTHYNSCRVHGSRRITAGFRITYGVCTRSSTGIEDGVCHDHAPPTLRADGIHAADPLHNRLRGCSIITVLRLVALPVREEIHLPAKIPPGNGSGDSGSPNRVGRCNRGRSESHARVAFNRQCGRSSRRERFCSISAPSRGALEQAIENRVLSIAAH
jgi:hypothetical protein